MRYLLIRPEQPHSSAVPPSSAGPRVSVSTVWNLLTHLQTLVLAVGVDGFILDGVVLPSLTKLSLSGGTDQYQRVLAVAPNLLQVEMYEDNVRTTEDTTEDIDRGIKEWCGGWGNPNPSIKDLSLITSTCQSWDWFRPELFPKLERLIIVLWQIRLDDMVGDRYQSP